LSELLKREEEAMEVEMKSANKQIPKTKTNTTETTRKAKGLSMKTPSFLFKKKSASSTRFLQQQKNEKNEEEKEEE
jgi:hypothetical protein